MLRRISIRFDETGLLMTELLLFRSRSHLFISMFRGMRSIVLVPRVVSQLGQGERKVIGRLVFVSLKKMVTMVASLAFIAGLAACTSPVLKSGVTRDRINNELGQAVSERKGAGIDAALMPPLKIEMPKMGATEVEPRFDLSVVGAPAGQVFMALVSGTRYSMLLPQELSGTITLNLKDVSVMEALDTIRELYGYEYKVQGTRIFIQPNSLQTRVFQINYLASKRMGSSDLRVSGSGGRGSGSGASAGGASSASAPSSGGATTAFGSDTSRVSTSLEADFWRDLNSALTSIIGNADGRGVVLNNLSGVVVVRGFPADLRNVENFLKATRLVVERQVMLEAKILAVVLSNGAQSGINWSLLNTIDNSRSMFGVMGRNSTLNTSISTDTTMKMGDSLSILPGKGGSATSKDLKDIATGFAGMALQTANFAALLSFLETQGEVAVLSSPRIATLNNQKALLKVGTDDIYIVNITPGTPGNANSAATPPTPTFQSFFSGISLDVTPQIDEDGYVILHIHPSVSNVTEVMRRFNLGGGTSDIIVPFPSSDINETDSIVRVKDGNIVAIGGLMRQEQKQSRSNLQGFGDDAPINTLLGQRDGDFKKTEMVVLIKPTIIEGDQTWQNELEAVRDRVQAMSHPKVQASQR